MGKTKEKEEVAAPAEPRDEKTVSVVVEGKESVFPTGINELPGMPEISRLRQLAGSWVVKAGEIAQLEHVQDKITQEIMMQLRSEGRTGFAYRESGSTYTFAINAPDEKLVVKRKKQ